MREEALEALEALLSAAFWSRKGVVCLFRLPCFVARACMGVVISTIKERARHMFLIQTSSCPYMKEEGQAQFMTCHMDSYATPRTLPHRPTKPRL